MQIWVNGFNAVVPKTSKSLIWLIMAKLPRLRIIGWNRFKFGIFWNPKVEVRNRICSGSTSWLRFKIVIAWWPKKRFAYLPEPRSKNRHFSTSTRYFSITNFALWSKTCWKTKKTFKFRQNRNRFCQKHQWMAFFKIQFFSATSLWLTERKWLRFTNNWPIWIILYCKLYKSKIIWIHLYQASFSPWSSKTKLSAKSTFIKFQDPSTTPQTSFSLASRRPPWPNSRSWYYNN